MEDVCRARSHSCATSSKKVSWNFEAKIIDVIVVRDAKRSVMGGGSLASGLLDICVGFPAKRKGPVLEVITSSLWNHGQTIAKFQHNIWQHCWVQHLPCVWPPCFDMLGVVGSNLKMAKFFIEHWRKKMMWMLYDVVVVRPGSYNNVAYGMCTSSMSNSQHVTRCNKVTKRVAPNNVAICCVQMLGSFGRSFEMLDQ